MAESEPLAETARETRARPEATVLRPAARTLPQPFAQVRAELDRVNRELQEDVRPDAPELVPLIEQVARYRGKQLRPALVLLSARACGAVRDEHIVVAKVVELIHTATLVHDDVLDGGVLRRQVPTVNALYGNEVPVLLGDYLYARAFHMAVQMSDQTCSRVLSETTRVVCQGEITQILHRFDWNLSEERYTEIVRDKTASLYAAACRLGGHYAGATPALVEALDHFGTRMGIAFQIVDDCLDLRGTEAVVGKSLGTDLDKGKMTLPLLHLLRSGAEVADRLRRMLSETAAEARLDRLRRDFDLDRAIAYALGRAEHHVACARRALQDFPAGPARDALATVAGYVLERQW
ncbi:MAG: polyprenyl synthetase family protein [Planctomycetes bacterium]|nr:polyprenyl synthetase family protein [Planctomycetota bacterium]